LHAVFRNHMDFPFAPADVEMSCHRHLHGAVIPLAYVASSSCPSTSTRSGR
jgi:hypothetical protein